MFAQFPSEEFEREQGGNGSQEVYMAGDGYAVIRQKYKNGEPENATPWMAITPDGEILGEYRTPHEAEAVLREHRNRQES